jgi:tetratricopeptide (TPR) repeat protein
MPAQISMPERTRIPRGLAVRPDAPVLLFAILLAAAAISIYTRTLPDPFFFDDIASIVTNPTIRHLGDIGAVLTPPSSSYYAIGVTGRPLVNLTLAINYAVGGLDPRGYHAVNLAIHVSASLALFGILRRTLEKMQVENPTGMAFAAALIWCVHPLLTESVTCVMHRTECLMGLCYLLTLYMFVRYSQSARHRLVWAGMAVFFCFAGMAAKEAMATAPVVVFLYDRSFVSGTFREAWRRNGKMHLALCSSWLMTLFLLLREGGSRGGAAGFGHGASSWHYLLTQCRAIMLYLRLSVWPHPLVIDYGTHLVKNPSQVWIQGLLLLGLIAIATWALAAQPMLGFLGACFFLLLAPSSSFVPLVTQTIAEHRMYLPLAPLAVIVVALMHRWCGRYFMTCCLAVAAALAVTTYLRNEDYSSVEALWRGAVANFPENERAYLNLGATIADSPARSGEAIVLYEKAIRLKPDYALAHNNLGVELGKFPGRENEAMGHFYEALKSDPNLAMAHNNLGRALSAMPGRIDDAISEYVKALSLKSDLAEAHVNLGNAYLQKAGGAPDALGQFREAIRLKPDFAEAHSGLGGALVQFQGRLDEAIAQDEEAIRIKPDLAAAHFNLGAAFMRLPERINDAVAQFRETLRLDAKFADAHYDLGTIWASIPGRMPDAASEFEGAVRLKPDFAEAQFNLASALLFGVPGRLNDAIEHYNLALQLAPGDPDTNYYLAVALSKAPGRGDEAKIHLEAVLKRQPNNVRARELLDSLGSR